MLTALQQGLFEPLQTVEPKFQRKRKTLLLLALASIKRVGDLHGFRSTGGFPDNPEAPARLCAQGSVPSPRLLYHRWVAESRLGSSAKTWICAAPAAYLYSRCDQRQLGAIIACQCALAHLVYTRSGLVSLHLHFTFMHLADAFIQSDLQCIQVIHFFCQYMCSLGIEPTTFALLTQCSNHWATGTLILWGISLSEIPICRSSDVSVPSFRERGLHT